MNSGRTEEFAMTAERRKNRNLGSFLLVYSFSYVGIDIFEWTRK